MRLVTANLGVQSRVRLVDLDITKYIQRVPNVLNVQKVSTAQILQKTQFLVSTTNTVQQAAHSHVILVELYTRKMAIAVILVSS